jgi:tRNA A-37 threonylcarbamoyl transferase component Bud32
MDPKQLLSGERSFLILGVQHGFLTPKQVQTVKLLRQKKLLSGDDSQDVTVLTRGMGFLNSESAFQILRLRARHGRGCKSCDRLTFLLPKQRSSQTHCEHCQGILTPIHGSLSLKRRPTHVSRPLRRDSGRAVVIRDRPNVPAHTEGVVFDRNDLIQPNKRPSSEVVSFLGMLTQVSNDSKHDSESESSEASTPALSSSDSSIAVDESVKRRAAAKLQRHKLKPGEVLSPSDLQQADAILGRTIDGCIIQELLCGGGMGNVFLGQHKMLEQKRVFKTLKPQFAKDRKMRARFLREARLAAKLDHPNVVPVINLAEIDDGEIIYLTMPFIEGQDLQQIVDKSGPLDERWLLQIAYGLSSALGYAHEKGMIHRDVKPANVIIDDSGRLRLTDFGLAKMQNDTKLTAAGAMVGTPMFMAPEANRPGSDFRVDIYSLGLTIYYAAVGIHALQGARFGDLMRGHAHSKIVDPRGKAPGLSHDFCRLLAQSLAPDPDNRFDTMDTFREAVARLRRGESSTRAYEWSLEID